MTNEMTNEEAKRVLEFDLDHTYNDESKEALRIAIKALETIPKYKDAYNKGWDDGAKASYEHLKMCEEEQEPCNDVISRQAVIDIIESWLSCDDYNEAERHIMRATESILYDLPSANPQEPTWVTGADGAKIAFKDVSAWKVIKICEILGDTQESEVEG